MDGALSRGGPFWIMEKNRNRNISMDRAVIPTTFAAFAALVSKPAASAASAASVASTPVPPESTALAVSSAGTASASSARRGKRRGTSVRSRVHWHRRTTQVMRGRRSAPPRATFFSAFR